MILAKIAFDAQNQQFHLTDPELAGAFQDGEMYLVIMDFLPTTLEKDIELSKNEASGFDLTDLREPSPVIGNA